MDMEIFFAQMDVFILVISLKFVFDQQINQVISHISSNKLVTRERQWSNLQLNLTV